MTHVSTTASGVQVMRLHDVMSDDSTHELPPEDTVSPPHIPHTPTKTTMTPHGYKPIWEYLNSTSPDLLAPGPHQAGGTSTMEDSEDPNDHNSEDNGSAATAATVVDTPATPVDTPTDTPNARSSYIVSPRTPLPKRPPRNRSAVRRVLPTQLTETRIKVDELEVHPSKVSTQPQPSPQP